MDSSIQRNGRLIDIVDWHEERLPDENIAVPAAELPDPEPDNGNPQETLREQEQKWSDLALNKISSSNAIRSTVVRQQLLEEAREITRGIRVMNRANVSSSDSSNTVSPSSSILSNSSPSSSTE